MIGIELDRRLKSIAVIGEVVLLLRQVGEKNLVAVGQRDFVVSVLLSRLARGSHNLIGLLLVARLQIAQGRHLHMRPHVHTAAGHGQHGVGAAIVIHPRQVRHGHGAHVWCCVGFFRECVSGRLRGTVRRVNRCARGRFVSGRNVILRFLLLRPQRQEREQREQKQGQNPSAHRAYRLY